MTRSLAVTLVAIERLAIALMLATVAVASPASLTTPEATSDATLAREPITPIPTELALAPATVALGRRLFHDTRLSADDTVSCATCHSLDTAGTDRRPRPLGIGGQIGEVNAPTVFNSGLNFKQFWDGRAGTLEEEVGGQIQNPAEMGSTWVQVIAKLRRDEAYVAAFAASYPDGIAPGTVANAIATFERSLSTPNSRFDRFLRGEPSALSETEKQGYVLFKAYGCASCHQGMNVGGNMLQSFGVMADYFADRGNVMKADLGRFNLTGLEEDRHVFKVPSLRLAALTPPYFHDGSAATLAEAVRVMAHYQLGRRLPDADVDRIVEFLGTLPGEYEGRPLAVVTPGAATPASVQSGRTR